MPTTHPNIIFVITDQQRFDTINALGASYVDTPNLDKLVNGGVSFTNCHVTAPSCVPSRASLFTGLYPHSTGIYKNGDAWRHSWVENLADGGYYCVNVGKMHTQPYETEMGFDERYVVENKDRYLADRYYFDEWDKALKAQGITKQQRDQYRQRDDYEERLGAFEWELPEQSHSDMFVGDTAEWWLDDKPQPEKPLFLQVGFPGPHPPYDPVPRYAEEYMQREFPLPEIAESDLADQPAPLNALREHHAKIDHDSIAHKLDPTDEQLHRQRAYYMANVAMIDEQVGQLVDALERNGYLDDCVVVFASDHGDALCDHGHSQKWTMYESVTRVPAIVWAPNRFEGGRQLNGLCSLMDLGPTMLELANVGVPEWMQAESLLPALNGQEWKGRNYVFAEQSRDAILKETEFMTMVRSEQWKLVHFIDNDKGQLFNLASDPKETENRWDDPAAAEQKQELLDVLRDWRIQSQYDARDRFADAR